MKTLALTTIFLSGVAAAEVKWVETKFWKAPQMTTMTVQLEGKESLAKQCAFFRKNLEQISSRGDLFAKYRKPLSPISLKLAVNSWEKLEKEVEVSEEESRDKLPYYTQKHAVTGIEIEDAKELEVVAGEKSLTAIARRLKVADSQIELVRNNNQQLVLNILGLDTACDLYEGSAFISAKAPSYILLNSDEIVKLEEFYNKKLLPEIKDLFDVKKEAIQFRALKLGNRTGQILGEEFPEMSEKDSEKMMMEVVSTLLNTKTLEASESLGKSNESYFACIGRSIEAQPVTLKLEF